MFCKNSFEFDQCFTEMWIGYWCSIYNKSFQMQNTNEQERYMPPMLFPFKIIVIIVSICSYFCPSFPGCQPVKECRFLERGLPCVLQRLQSFHPLQLLCLSFPVHLHGLSSGNTKLHSPVEFRSAGPAAHYCLGRRMLLTVKKQKTYDETLMRQG